MSKLLVQTNPIAQLLRSVADIAEKMGLRQAAAPLDEKERAVTKSAIWAYVQNELDQMGGAVDEYGHMISAGYVCDVYLDSNGPFALATKSDGKLWKIPVNIDEQSQITAGEPVEVFMDFPAVERGSIVIKRQKDGRIRWIAGPACTAILNRSGEIDSRDLFDSFEDYIARTGEYPVLDFYHFGSDLTFGTADLVFRDGVNYVATGLFDETDVARAMADAIEKDPGYWGLSIQYLPTEAPEILRSAEGVEIPVYRKGINHFISILPEDSAAAILTNISTKEVKRMNAAQEKALKKALEGDDTLFQAVADKLNNVNRTASQPGVVTRSAATSTETAAAPATNAAKPAPKAPATKREWSKEDIKELVGTPEFKIVLDEVMSASDSTAPDGNEDESGEQGEGTPEGTEEVSTARAILALVTELKEDRKQRATAAAGVDQQLSDDMPARSRGQALVRARAAVTPAIVNGSGAGLDLASIAEQTLEKMGAAEG
jgi:hypothetical protein